MNYLGIILTVCLLNTVFTQEVKKVGDCVWATSDLTLDLRDFGFLEYDNPSGVATYRYYPCTINADWDPDNCAIRNKPALCQENYEAVTYIVGKQETASVKIVSKDTFELTYTDGNDGRKGVVTLSCFQNSDEFKFDYEEYPTYFFSMSVENACKSEGYPGGSTGGDDGGFALFIILVLASIFAVTTYIVGGMLFMYLHKKERGIGLIPNLAFWKDSPFLFRDGFLFTFSFIPQVREYMKDHIKEDYSKVPS
ncbi:Cation-dependent mannose-6-phosphate receptor-like [Oopsacas minuta]|uniref:Cation-dependent mannose-6-phosphate receptor-like n=1 Tax=Oopsacas minuta TaxID=111878 RepID=A0AAV7JNH6_9METZ|nr:Cation-dependent mannose-6-phosphate receptor-like [Oopsacas minuta]